MMMERDVPFWVRTVAQRRREKRASSPANNSMSNSHRGVNGGVCYKCTVASSGDHHLGLLLSGSFLPTGGRLQHTQTHRHTHTHTDQLQ